MIPGVEIKVLTTYQDRRGFFREVIRDSDPFFAGAFGQWSHSLMYTGAIKAWHLHQKQTDWWYCPVGMILTVVAKIEHPVTDFDRLKNLNPLDCIVRRFDEFVMGEQSPMALKIPPGVAHGLKVLQGPAHLLYVTSHEYDGSDEGRLPYNALGYDWHKEVIK